LKVIKLYYHNQTERNYFNFIEKSLFRNIDFCLDAIQNENRVVTGCWLLVCFIFES